MPQALKTLCLDDFSILSRFWCTSGRDASLSCLPPPPRTNGESTFQTPFGTPFGITLKIEPEYKRNVDSEDKAGGAFNLQLFKIVKVVL